MADCAASIFPPSPDFPSLPRFSFSYVPKRYVPASVIPRPASAPHFLDLGHVLKVANPCGKMS